MPILQHLNWIFQNAPTFSVSDGFQNSYGHVFWDHPFLVHPIDIRISIIRFGKLASSPVWEDVCEGEESDGDEYEGGVPGDQSADQVAVHCTAHQYRRYGYVPHLKYRLQVWRASICFAIIGPIISPRRVILYSVADLALAPGLLSAECGDSEYFLQFHKWRV